MSCPDKKTASLGEGGEKQVWLGCLDLGEVEDGDLFILLGFLVVNSLVNHLRGIGG